MENENIKELLKKFLDCKENTSLIAEKALKNGNLESMNHVIKEQTDCLDIITKIQSANIKSIDKYSEGIKASRLRIMSEKKFLERIIKSNDLENLAGNSFAISILTQKEKETWNIIEKNNFPEPKASPENYSSPIFLYSSVFIILSLLLILKKNGILKNITAEKIRLYFQKNLKIEKK